MSKIIKLDEYRPQLVGEWSTICPETEEIFETGTLWDRPGLETYKAMIDIPKEARREKWEMGFWEKMMLLMKQWRMALKLLLRQN